MTMLRVVLLSVLFGVSVVSVAADGQQAWKLVWSEEFDAHEIDGEVWSKIPRGGADNPPHFSCEDGGGLGAALCEREIIVIINIQRQCYGDNTLLTLQCETNREE